MKIKFKSKLLEKELEPLFKAIKSNSAFIPLQGLLINFEKDKTIIIASNGNLSIKKIIINENIIKTIEPGKILINAMIFKNVIKKQNADFVIEKINNTLKISSNESIANIQLFNIDDYPNISFDVEGKEILLDGQNLIRAIKNISFAAAENDTRIILNGVNIKSKGNNVVLSATNTYRLALEKIEKKAEHDFDITILSKNLKEFIPTNVVGNIKINVDDNKIITEYKNTTISSKLIDGIYPEVEPLIPSEFKYLLSIESRDLMNTIEKASPFSEEGNKQIKITITKEVLLIESKRKEMASIEVKYFEHTWSGTDFSIILNSQFLKDAINKFGGKIAVAFNGSFEPVVIRGKSNPNLIQLILPQRSY